ncbi:hypothetical protein BDZ89DRAFT_1141029 [Hymenopellis radicata]|nr:hypothetical protein BDZ89DRAFT_1141029 [Hymenopellis radicata]
MSSASSHLIGSKNATQTASSELTRRLATGKSFTAPALIAKASKQLAGPTEEELVNALVISRKPSPIVGASYQGNSDVYASDPEEFTGKYARPRQQAAPQLLPFNHSSRIPTPNVPPTRKSRSISPKKPPGFFYSLCRDSYAQVWRRTAAFTHRRPPSAVCSKSSFSQLHLPS